MIKTPNSNSNLNPKRKHLIEGLKLIKELSPGDNPITNQILIIEVKPQPFQYLTRFVIAQSLILIGISYFALGVRILGYAIGLEVVLAFLVTFLIIDLVSMLIAFSLITIPEYEFIYEDDNHTITF